MVCGTVTGAAELLHLSQPTISGTIANLEHQLGFDLFIRDKGRLTPTPEANNFYVAALQTLDSMDRTVEVAQEIRDGQAGHLTIATYPGIALHFMPRLLGEFLDGRAGVRVKLLSRSSSVIRGWFPAHRFDLGVSELPVDNTALDVETFSFECVCVMNPQHALAREPFLTPTILDGVPFVALFREHATYHQLAVTFSEAKANWNVTLETEYFETACASAAAGVGIALIDPITALSRPEGEIAVRRFKPTIRYEIGILVPRDQPPSRLTLQFMGLLRDRLAPFTV